MASPTSLTPAAQKRAIQAAVLARQLMNARKPDTAIQECVLLKIVRIVKEPVFTMPGLKWPSGKPAAYMAMIRAVDRMRPSTFTRTTDKALLRKFLTEQLGMEGARYEVRRELKKDIPDDQFEEFHGPHVVNAMVTDDQPPNPTGRTIATEAKGGRSQLKGDQGTAKNLKKEAKLMSSSNFKSRKKIPGETPDEQKKRVAKEKQRRRDAGDKLGLAIASKKVTFLTVRTLPDPTKKPKLEKRVKL